MLFSAAVLAGGRSQRFGQDKALFMHQGKPMAQWVLDSLVDADERFIVAKRVYTAFAEPTVFDHFDLPCPLSGLHAALRYARHPWVAVAACDLPRLRPAYWSALLPYLDGAVAVGVKRSGHPEPLAAFYHRSLLPETERRLKTGELALHRLLSEVGARVLPWEVLELAPESLQNVNTRNDLV